MLAALEILELQKWPNSEPISQFMEFSELASTMYSWEKSGFMQTIHMRRPAREMVYVTGEVISYHFYVMIARFDQILNNVVALWKCAPTPTLLSLGFLIWSLASITHTR
jgi:hypothetical protein